MGGRGHGRVGFATLMAMMMTQKWLPFNPKGLDNLSWHLAFNTAWSFTCNADWQSYSGESTMSYLSQTLGLSVHQFLSGATGLAVLVAVGRALAGVGQDDRQLLGRSDPLHPLHRDSAFGSLGDPARLAGRPADLEGLPERDARRTLYGAGPENGRQGQPVTTSVAKLDDKGKPVVGPDGKAGHGRPAGHGGPEGRDPAPPGRPGRLLRVVQAAFHKRRRLVRRQQRASLRKSDAARRIPRNAGDHRRADGAGVSCLAC